jgi:hypothetical protein
MEVTPRLKEEHRTGTARKHTEEIQRRRRKKNKQKKTKKKKKICCTKLH